MSNNEEPQATNASSLSASPLLRRQGYFILFIDVHMRSGEHVSKTVALSNLASGEGFLGSNLRDYSFASSSSSSRLVYLFVGRTPRVVAFNVNFVRLIIVVKEPQVTYSFSSQIMSYILNMLIYVGMILLDNMLQCLFFIAMIDLSRTCGSTISLICNALLMFMIYSWIKIKLKVLIFSTIQKPYCRHFSFMAGFVDALKPTPFTGANFKRWQMSHIVANCYERVLGIRGQA
jgi:hypothetical protein